MGQRQMLLQGGCTGHGSDGVLAIKLPWSSGPAMPPFHTQHGKGMLE